MTFYEDPNYIMKPGPHQRSYSVMAVPNELENKYIKSTQPRQDPLAWYQEIYQKYGYEPKLKQPTFFGPYLLLQTLGEGEFAKVKAAVHIQTNQDVAIKLIRKDLIQSGSLETKLDREISILKSVDHPNIVKLFEVISIKNYIGIVLQRASGGELFDYILKHHYLQENEAKRLFSQLISGVSYMHQNHIVHRDLKLENLLLSQDRNIIITDFGFANQIDKEDLMVTSCGSPCYAAPELVMNEDARYVGTAADIWSCGVILFAMLCGYLPFDDDPNNPQGLNINVLYKYILSTPLDIPTTVSQDATHLLRRMLVPDPKQRCTMEEIQQHPWLLDTRSLNSASNQSVLNTQTHQPEARENWYNTTCTTTSDFQNNSNSNSSNNIIHQLLTPPITPPISSSSSSSTAHDTFKNPVTSFVHHEPIFTNGGRRTRTTSEFYTSQANPKIYPKQHVFMLPSVSEQTSILDQAKSRSTSKKLMEWFKRTTPSHFQNTNRMKEAHSNTRVKALFGDHKVRSHRGAIDQDALTSSPPQQVFESIKEALNQMGIEVKKSLHFKLKCIRPSKFNSSRTKTFQMFFNHHNHPKTIPPAIYGESGIDSGEEIQFTVQVVALDNLRGLYMVDIKRTRGNIWAFKFLYHTLLDLLDLEYEESSQSHEDSHIASSSSDSSMVVL